MKFSYSIIAALALGLPAMAQSSDLITSMSEADFAEFAESQGHDVLGFGEAGKVSIRAMTGDGTTYYLTGTACSDLGDCKGVNMSARFQYEDWYTLASINTANIERAAVSVWKLDNVLGISRYVILDDGVTPGNLQSNFDNFLAIVPYVIESMRN